MVEIIIENRDGRNGANRVQFSSNKGEEIPADIVMDELYFAFLEVEEKNAELEEPMSESEIEEAILNKAAAELDMSWAYVPVYMFQYSIGTA